MKYEQIIKELKKFRNPKNIEGMKQFGIKGETMLGISMPNIRNLGKKIGKNHELALKLWKSRIHEARILASIIDEPKKVTEKQMDLWIKDFDSWDVCDQTCMNLFYQLPCAYEKAMEWSKRKKEFEKRAGFALMACLAWKDKKAENKKFIRFLLIIKKESIDERNFVKKAVNWALRQIGKRNSQLKKEAIKTTKEILKKDSRTAKWIANDALRELSKK
ncbi:MAG: DNA alkylation repair protein [Candidatus Pacearchaeota archaeon]|nr:MAG: DNA alkylation repair protein [Candidatus Pacearchaeota archaeon]